MCGVWREEEESCPIVASSSLQQRPSTSPFSLSAAGLPERAILSEDEKPNATLSRLKILSGSFGLGEGGSHPPP